jgi:ABC-type Mn2+/Zn2+ transport system permease subunit
MWSDILDFPFMQRALIVALGIGPLCGVVGVFMLLRGLAFFGDAVAHVSLTGIALALLLGLAPDSSPLFFTGILVVTSLTAASLVSILIEKTKQRADTLLAVLMSGCVAFSMIVISRAAPSNPNQVLVDYLFGNLFTLQDSDVAMILVLFAAVVGVLLVYRRPLVMVTLNQEYAQSLGISVTHINRLFMLLIALTVAVSIRFLGTLLVTALLVIPAAAARNWAGSFRQLLILSAVLGAVSAEGGVLASFRVTWLPTAPTIVVLAAAIFAVSLVLPASRIQKIFHREEGKKAVS